MSIIAPQAQPLHLELYIYIFHGQSTGYIGIAIIITTSYFDELPLTLSANGVFALGFTQTQILFS